MKNVLNLGTTTSGESISNTIARLDGEIKLMTDDLREDALIHHVNPSGMEGRCSVADITATLLDRDAQLSDEREMWLRDFVER